MPRPYLPEGLKLDPFEGTGEVQTPLSGPTADRLKIGDKVITRGSLFIDRAAAGS